MLEYGSVVAQILAIPMTTTLFPMSSFSLSSCCSLLNYPDSAYSPLKSSINFGAPPVLHSSSSYFKCHLIFSLSNVSIKWYNDVRRWHIRYYYSLKRTDPSMILMHTKHLLEIRVLRGVGAENGHLTIYNPILPYKATEFGKVSLAETILFILIWFPILLRRFDIKHIRSNNRFQNIWHPKKCLQYFIYWYASVVRLGYIIWEV